MFRPFHSSSSDASGRNLIQSPAAAETGFEVGEVSSPVAPRGIEPSLARTLRRADAVAVALLDWHRGLLVSHVCASGRFDPRKLEGVMTRFARTLAEIAKLRVPGDSIDDLVVDTNGGRHVLRLVPGTSWAVIATVPGATTNLEPARAQLRSLEIEVGGTVPRLRSSFRS